MKHVKCIVCGSDECARVYSSVDNTLFLVEGVFRLVRCLRCGLVYLNPCPTKEETAVYYEDGYYAKEKGARFVSVAEGLVYLFRRLRIGLIERISKKGRILDVGCGRGIVLHELSKRGWDVSGTQLSANAVNHIKEEFGLDVFRGELMDAGYPGGVFDIVTMWHVLEHLVEPSLYLREVRRVLRDGGTLFVEVPNAGSLQARLFKENWLGSDLPRHIYHFTKPSLTRFLKESGFTVERVDDFSLEFGPFILLQSILNYLFGCDNFLFRTFVCHQKVRAATRMQSLRLAAYLASAAFLAAPVTVASCVLSMAGSGDVMRFICRKEGA